MTPALEMISMHVKCPILRVSVLAKFVQILLLQILILSQQEISYISSQLIETMIEGSSKDWYTDLSMISVSNF